MAQTKQTSLSDKDQSPQNQQTVQPSRQKSIAVLLAVFFGLFTWLYTYRRDNWKFWLNLALTVVTFGFWGFAAWIWAIIDTATKDDNWYSSYTV